MVIVLDVPSADVPLVALVTAGHGRHLADAAEEVARTGRAQILQRLGHGDLDVLLGDLVGGALRVHFQEAIDHRVSADAREPQVCLLGRQLGEQVVAHRAGHASLAVMKSEVSEAVEPAGDTIEVEEELLVEEISIDGMCGVY